MKRLFACAAAVFIAGGLALSSFGDDVYAKAFYWCRGMGVDANGNGKLDSGELYDSLNLHAPASSSVGANHPVFTNEMVRMPCRGVLRPTTCASTWSTAQAARCSFCDSLTVICPPCGRRGS